MSLSFGDIKILQQVGAVVKVRVHAFQGTKVMALLSTHYYNLTNDACMVIIGQKKVVVHDIEDKDKTESVTAGLHILVSPKDIDIEEVVLPSHASKQFLQDVRDRFGEKRVQKRKD